MTDTITNKVSESGIITLDLENWFPKEPIDLFDLKDYLFMELILKEKDFRQTLINFDWEIYKNKNVALFCSTDAIVPLWAYMLVTVYLQPVAKSIYAGSVEEMKKDIFIRNIQSINPTSYIDARVVVKGCGDVKIDAYAYTEITRILQPVVKSLMYGEPCSTVPLFKKKI
jgi:hypothetical protein